MGNRAAKSMSRNSSLFITFEGGEAAGKTTLIEGVGKALTAMGKQVVVTREPGGTVLGESIRNLLLQRSQVMRIFPTAELLLFLASRAQHVQEVIIPALDVGSVVLCDRFNDSTVVYQGIARSLGAETVAELCNIACQGVYPDRTFLLDIDPHTAELRKVHEGRVSDRMESEELAFHIAVRDGFLQLAQENPDRIERIDASQSREQVLQQALKSISWLISLKA